MAAVTLVDKGNDIPFKTRDDSSRIGNPAGNGS